MAGRFRSEFTQTFIFIQAFNDRLHHSRRATQLRQFEPDSDFGYARACSLKTLNLYLAELTRVGEPKCIHGKKFSRVEG